MAIALDLPPAANAPRPSSLASDDAYQLPPPASHLSPEQVEELGRELDAIRQRHVDDLGDVDRAYIHRMVALQRALEVGGRGLLFAGFLPPAWLGGTLALGLAKILDNMEIGHNVMHGQYDWMEDPVVHSSTWEWDNVAPSEAWRHGHNVVHHTWTNVVGKDRDVGYGLLRMSEQQPWRPRDLGNPLYAAALSLMFEYGVALHELEADRIMDGDKPMDEAKPLLAAIRAKAGAQAKKDYLVFPVLAGPLAPFVITGNVTANLIRNVWAFAVIFCGHFPDGVEQFTEEDLEGETRARWYLRQLLGSANLTGGPVFHVLTGNLSHQIEHHLFPDLPAWRYATIAEDIRELTDRYDLPYHTGPLPRQFASVVKRIVELSLPDETRHQPDPRRSFPRFLRDEIGGRTLGGVRRRVGRLRGTVDRLAEHGRSLREGAEVVDLPAASGRPAA